MEYKKEIVEKMLADPRWVGAIQDKMVRVWKTRGTIPNQYFNQKYIKLIKEGKFDLANQIKDPYFNEDFILRIEQSPEEKLEHDKLLKVLRSEKINLKQLSKLANVQYSMLADALKTTSKQVDLRPEHVLMIKKALQSFRIKVKNVVEKLQTKNTFWDSDKKMISEILESGILVLEYAIANKAYQHRIADRKARKVSIFEDSEARFYVDKLAVFLLETAL